ncbi:MAG: hypothetical protein ACI4F4_02825 [Lachnospiraceae bacterium]
MKQVNKNNIVKNKGKFDYNILWIIGILFVLHLICNLQIRNISFATDEYIPLIVAADNGGLDWLHCTDMNYYYGYLTLLFFIPIFKIPFIYNSPFLLTQSVLFVNSVFHIISAVFMYLILREIRNNIDSKICMIITLVVSTTVQFFSVGQGAQIEALYLLCGMIVFYCIVKIAAGENYWYYYTISAVFSICGYIQNSRGLVVIIACSLVMLLQLCIERKKCLKNTLVYFGSLLVAMCAHLFVFKKMYMQYFVTGAANTDEGSFVEKIKLMFSDSSAFVVVIKTFLSYVWSVDVSTYGLFILTLLVVIYHFFKVIKEKNKRSILIDSFVLLMFCGMFVLTSIFAISRNMLYFSYNSDAARVDFLFYVRYLIIVYILVIPVGMLYFLQNKVRWTILLSMICSLGLYGFYDQYVGPYINNGRYGVNNSIYISLFFKGFTDDHRYGYVNISSIVFLELIALIVMVLIYSCKNIKAVRRVYFIILLVSIGFCIENVNTIANPRGDYYADLFGDALDYCKSSEGKTIFVNAHSEIAQYNMADKVIYGDEIDNQDLLLVRKNAVLDIEDTDYEKTYEDNRWAVYTRVKD